MLSRNVMEGIAHELEFWKGFVQTPRFLGGWVSPVKTPELRDPIYNWLKSLPDHESLKIVDVGSGVVSILNGSFPKENITTVDPLGSLYPFVFDYAAHGINPPVPCGGEEMEFEDEFDIAHISNAIDHTQNPRACFDRLMRAVKPGGYVIVQGFENEAIAENWQGFHQWNFTMDPESGDVVYSGKDGSSTKLQGNQVFKELIPVEDFGKNWFISIWQKPVTAEDRHLVEVKIENLTRELNRLKSLL